NKSLSALGNVISQLSENAPFIQYRDSKLTRILQESLGGNSRTTIIICCSPASYNESETKSTLQFGQRAKKVKNVVMVNEEISAEEWKRRYEREKEKVLKLRSQLEPLTAELKLWRSGNTVTDPCEIIDLSQFDPITNQMEEKSDDKLDILKMDTDDNQVKSLYKLIDDKEFEISNLTNRIEQLSNTLEEVQKQLEESERKEQILLTEKDSHCQELVDSHDKVQSVVQALNDLVGNFNEKSNENKKIMEERDNLVKSIENNQETLLELQKACDIEKENWNKKSHSMIEKINLILNDNSDMMGMFNNTSHFDRPYIYENSNINEEFDKAKEFTQTLKEQLEKALKNKENIENELNNVQRQCRTVKSQYEESQLLQQQQEIKLKNFHENCNKLIEKKSELEMQLDITITECSKTFTRE
ncbi:hypothetical protein SNEBB_007894, partial [Seison nebaliae]